MLTLLRRRPCGRTGQAASTRFKTIPSSSRSQARRKIARQSPVRCSLSRSGPAAPSARNNSSTRLRSISGTRRKSKASRYGRSMRRVQGNGPRLHQRPNLGAPDQAGTAKACARMTGIDPEMIGKTWRGVALRSDEVDKMVRIAGGLPTGFHGVDTPFAWCFGHRVAEDNG